jgi:hypothetical protein
MHVNCLRDLLIMLYMFWILELLPKILLGKKKSFTAKKKFENHCLVELMK